MNALAVLVLGLLIGWLVEWAIDWSYWRRRIDTMTSENTTLRERITSLETEKSKRPSARRSKLLTDENGNDNLQAIKGIGPAFARRLHEAGIYTFEQLSRLTPEELEEVLGTLYRRFFSKQETIRAQAEEFAQLKAQQR